MGARTGHFKKMVREGPSPRSFDPFARRWRSGTTRAGWVCGPVRHPTEKHRLQLHQRAIAIGLTEVIDRTVGQEQLDGRLHLAQLVFARRAVHGRSIDVPRSAEQTRSRSRCRSTTWSLSSAGGSRLRGHRNVASPRTPRLQPRGPCPSTLRGRSTRPAAWKETACGSRESRSYR